MLQPPPARPGMREDEVDTPALLLDLDSFEFNLDKMAGFLRANPTVRLRAHAKTHKSPVIAHLQMTRGGAIGQCVQKVAEAEILAWGGVPDILISNEVAGASKLARMASLAHICKIAICADDGLQVDAIATAAKDAGVQIEVLIEIDAGGGRCGIQAGPPAVDLARKIASMPQLRFGGIQAYHGSAQHKRTVQERRQSVAAAVQLVKQTTEVLADAGLKCRIIGGAGTGTFEYEAASGIYNELQAGSYIFMDADYGRNLDETGSSNQAFRQSLFVLSTVMSVPRQGTAVLDAGHKAVAIDSGLPLTWNRPGIEYVDASDEHGKLSIAKDAAAPALGEKLRLVPGHCDPTVDRYDWYVGVRRGRVECLWPVAARGAMY
jgi:D-serine deaminase-like pyridoxal phosphate-dependent protein